MTDQPGVTIDDATNTVEITRSYSASVQRAWFAWTDADQLSRWWGPQGWTTTVHEMDVRTGGRWRFTLAPDDGSADPVRVLAHYSEVVRHNRLAYRDTFADAGWQPEGEDTFATTVAFAVAEQGCTVRLRASFPDSDALRRAVEAGMVDGYADALERLRDALPSDN